MTHSPLMVTMLMWFLKRESSPLKAAITHKIILLRDRLMDVDPNPYLYCLASFPWPTTTRGDLILAILVGQRVRMSFAGTFTFT